MQNYKNMDEYFESLFGYKPSKRGTGYELLVSAVLKIMNEGQDVTHNVEKTGLFSTDKYQIDALIKNKLFSIFVECKDNTEKNKPTPRSDIQKLAGALNNLDINAGILASATGFTKPTIQYSKATKLNPNAKEIELFLIRPSKDKDTDGLIMSICISLDLQLIDEENSKLIPIMNKDIVQTILKNNNYKVGDSVSINTSVLLKADGSIYKHIADIANDKTFNKPDIDNVCRGSFYFDEKVFTKICGELVEIERLDYEVVHKTIHIPEFVKVEDKAILKVESSDKKIDRIITEKQLKNIIFKEDGTIIYKGKY